MSWAGLTANQVVSLSNLKDALDNSVFVTGPSSLTGTNRELLKRDAANYAYIDTSNAGYIVKASNQLMVKGDLTPGATFGGATQSSIYIANTSLDISISDVQLNGTSMTGISFPVTPGNNAMGYSTFMGTGATLTVSYTFSISGQHIGFTDSALTSACADLPPSTSPHDFTGVVAGATAMYLDVGDGACF